MASKQAAPPRNGAVAPLDRKNAAAAGARKALEDIGNVVPVRVPDVKQPVINRPVTRNFGAQLLANARAAAAAAAKTPAEPVAKTDAAAAQHVIEISSGSEGSAVPMSTSAGMSGTAGRIRARKIDTMTRLLTARSKLVCKSNSPADIDEADAGNQLAVVEYVADLYSFYKQAEQEYRAHDYMPSQPEFTERMRAILVDWIVEVHGKFELSPETLYLTAYVVDRFLSLQTTARRELQLVGIAAMLIACKYEEIWAPEVDDFVCISDRAYSRAQILAMEKKILNRMEWNLTVPTQFVFLVRFLKVARDAAADKEMENMAFFYSELSLLQYPLVLCCPSMVAATAVYLARCTLNRSPFWTGALRRHTSYSEQQLLDCAQVLVSAHAAAPEGKLKAVYLKYSCGKRNSVALIAPATKLMEELKACALLSRFDISA